MLLQQLLHCWRPLGERVLEPVCGNPSSYIPLFASHTDLLLRFLRCVVKREKPCDSSTWNTLLEMVLREETSHATEVEGENKVMKVLMDPNARYDPEEALILVQTYNHAVGETYLFKKNGMYSLLLQRYLHNNDSQAAITLWQGLRYAAKFSLDSVDHDSGSTDSCEYFIFARNP